MDISNLINNLIIIIIIIIMIIIVTIYATDVSIIKEIKGDVKNQQYEDTDLEHGGSWVRIPSGAQIFYVSSYS